MIRTSLTMLGLLLAATATADPLLWERSLDEMSAGLEQRSTAAVNGWGIRPNAALIEQETNRLVIPLPDRSQVVVERQRVFHQSAHSTSWAGVGADRTEVLLTVRGGWMAGLIRTGDQTWEVRPDAEHGSVLLKLDAGAFPKCSGGLEPSDPDGGHEHHTHDHAPARPQSPPQQSASSGGEGPVVMDLLALYTPSARQAYGGTAQIEAHAEAAIANANHSFNNSEVDAQFRIVAIEEIDYNESNNCSNDLNWVRNSPAAQQLRDQYGADMVGMLVQVSYCGCGFVMRSPGPAFAASAYQVTATQCAVGNLTYAHEHGHNMGMEHDPEWGTSPGNASYPWSFGHFVSGAYRTVMSYANECTGGCPRSMHFSNPDVIHQGHPTGIADQRDNARTARLTAPIIAAFREPVGPPQAVVTPVSVDLDLETDEEAQVGITIGNEGQSNLEWEVGDAKGCDAPSQLDWLDITPAAGTVAAGDEQEALITINAGALPTGETTATLCLSTNDDDQLNLQIPVTVDVSHSGTVIAGEVIGMGYCRNDPAPLASALIVIQGQHANYTAVSDADGQFEIVVPKNESDVSITASAMGHVAGSVHDIELLPGDELPVDLELRLRAPCASLTADSLDFRMAAGTASRQVIIDNLEGDAALHWSFHHDRGCSRAQASWLSVSPEMGVIAPGNEREITISVQADALDPGTYSAGWCVETDDEQWPGHDLAVELEIVPIEILQERFETD